MEYIQGCVYIVDSDYCGANSGIRAYLSALLTSNTVSRVNLKGKARVYTWDRVGVGIRYQAEEG